MATLGLASLAPTIATRFLSAHGGVASWASWAASLLVSLTLAFSVILFLYRLVPAADVRVRDAWPAALAIALLLVAAQNLFAVYVSNFSHLNAIYGSRGAVIARMFFVYLAAELLLLGAEMASEWPRLREEFEHDESRSPRAPLIEQSARLLRGLRVHRDERTPPDEGDEPRD